MIFHPLPIRQIPAAPKNERQIIDQTPQPPTDITVRLAACNLCAWKVGDRCQHPAQGCAPCKQGRGLSAMLATRAFKCPLKLF